MFYLSKRVEPLLYQIRFTLSKICTRSYFEYTKRMKKKWAWNSPLLSFSDTQKKLLYNNDFQKNPIKFFRRRCSSRALLAVHFSSDTFVSFHFVFYRSIYLFFVSGVSRKLYFAPLNYNIIRRGLQIFFCSYCFHSASASKAATFCGRLLGQSKLSGESIPVIPCWYIMYFFLFTSASAG